MLVKKFLTQIFTEPDNQTFCPIRIVALIGIVQYFGLTIANYVQHADFNAQGFAVGLGALIGGTGMALGLKKDTQPQGDKHV